MLLYVSCLSIKVVVLSDVREDGVFQDKAFFFRDSVSGSSHLGINHSSSRKALIFQPEVGPTQSLGALGGAPTRKTNLGTLLKCRWPL